MGALYALPSQYLLSISKYSEGSAYSITEYALSETTH
jgi:hypothetical protein